VRQDTKELRGQPRNMVELPTNVLVPFPRVMIIPPWLGLQRLLSVNSSTPDVMAVKSIGSSWNSCVSFTPNAESFWCDSVSRVLCLKMECVMIVIPFQFLRNGPAGTCTPCLPPVIIARCACPVQDIVHHDLVQVAHTWHWRDTCWSSIDCFG